MISKLRHVTTRLSSIACLLAASVFSHNVAAATPSNLPSIVSFFQNSTFSGAKLSPNAKFVAIRISTREGRAQLAVLDLATFKSTVVASFEESDIGEFFWVNDTRIVFNLTNLQLAQGDQYLASGMFAVNIDGSKFKQLVQTSSSFWKAGNGGRALLKWNTFLRGAIGNQESDEIYVVQPEAYDDKGQVDYVNLQRLNTLTGHITDVDMPLLHAHRWLMDGQGNPRVAVTYEKNIKAIHYKDPATEKWQKLTEFDAFTGNDIDPFFYDGDGKLIVTSNNGKDKTSLYIYDLAKNKMLDNPLVTSPDFDIKAEVISNNGKLLGVRYEIDAEVTQWFDPKMKTVQQLIDALLPNTVNQLSIAQRAESPIFIVKAYSDIQPALYLLFNAETKKLTKLGSVNSDIDPQKMGMKDMVRYQARDGLSIPAYLTLPKDSSKKNLPMVVLVHGGPFLRGGHWTWNADAQFLASRGYAVLEPEFRGSTGFGGKHFRAGWKQWGLAMQDDVADGTKWAIDQGIADPKRICIAGASYGGYSTLMGLVKDPGLYRCGINWVGVTDINLMYDVNWSDFSDIWKRYGMPLMVGDQVKDAAQLKATSPLENANKIKQPLLMAYGGADRRVPLIHGEKFYAAVKKENSNVEWIVYEKEGHGWSLVKTRVDFWSHVEKFLGKNIGNP
ncbi:MAG: prolyl oligopeptidase family serine peptidase [Pseudomonadota bacterium]